MPVLGGNVEAVAPRLLPPSPLSDPKLRPFRQAQQGGPSPTIFHPYRRLSFPPSAPALFPIKLQAQRQSFRMKASALIILAVSLTALALPQRDADGATPTAEHLAISNDDSALSESALPNAAATFARAEQTFASQLATLASPSSSDAENAAPAPSVQPYPRHWDRPSWPR